MYHKIIIYIFLFAVLKITSGNDASTENRNFFRKDYKYFESTESFYKFHSIPRTWGEAVETCADEGAGLFYPEDESEANVVLDYMNRTQGYFYDLFLGISDLDKENNFKTIDGRSILEVYIKWDASEPNNADKGEDCVALRKQGSFNDVPCSDKYSFICKKTLDSVQWNTACGMPYFNGQRDDRFFKENYKYLDDTKNFYKVYKSGSSWINAKHTCEREGASLFFPEDQDEADAVMAYVRSNYDITHSYLGISDLIAKTVYKTIDGRSIFDVYNKWESHEPNNALDVEDCVVLRLSDGTFNDVPCGNSWSYICKKPLATLNRNEPDYDLQKELGSCYRFHSTPMKWGEAQALCGSEQSHLVIINSLQEAQYLMALTAGSPTNLPRGYTRGVVHIGFHNRLNEGWETVSGTALEDSGFNDWGNIDHNVSYRQKCGSMLYNGHLKDIGCDKKAVFICEHEIN